MNQKLVVSLAQISPIWLNKQATIEKMKGFVEQAAKANANLVAFGEALLPGYPFWVELTGGAQFENAQQKEICLLYTSPSPRDLSTSRMPSSA